MHNCPFYNNSLDPAQVALAARPAPTSTFGSHTDNPMFRDLVASSQGIGPLAATYIAGTDCCWLSGSTVDRACVLSCGAR